MHRPQADQDRRWRHLLGMGFPVVVGWRPADLCPVPAETEPLDLIRVLNQLARLTRATIHLGKQTVDWNALSESLKHKAIELWIDRRGISRDDWIAILRDQLDLSRLPERLASRLQLTNQIVSTSASPGVLPAEAASDRIVTTLVPPQRMSRPARAAAIATTLLRLVVRLGRQNPHDRLPLPTKGA